MSSFSNRIDQLDERLDGYLEPVRNSRLLVYVFNTSSAVGDFGAIWHVIGIVGALNGTLTWPQAVTLALLMGGESLLLNQGIKRVFRRERPTVAAMTDSPYADRSPAVFQAAMPHRRSLQQWCSAVG